MDQEILDALDAAANDSTPRTVLEKSGLTIEVKRGWACVVYTGCNREFWYELVRVCREADYSAFNVASLDDARNWRLWYTSD